MATHSDTPTESKVRTNLSLSAGTIEQGEELRKETRRNSFSNVVEWLIDEEWKRREAAKQEKALAS